MPFCICVCHIRCAKRRAIHNAGPSFDSTAQVHTTPAIHRLQRSDAAACLSTHPGKNSDETSGGRIPPAHVVFRLAPVVLQPAFPVAVDSDGNKRAIIFLRRDDGQAHKLSDTLVCAVLSGDVALPQKED